MGKLSPFAGLYKPLLARERPRPLRRILRQAQVLRRRNKIDTPSL